MGDIGIVIVTFNSAAEIGACLDAAMGTGAQGRSRNGSQDGTPRRRSARSRGHRAAAAYASIANSSNQGFAAAVNQGFAAHRDCPYVLVLNPDAVLASPLEPMRDACARPGVAAAGGCLVDSEGRPQVGFMVRRFPTPAVLVLEALLLNRLWPRNPINRRYRELDLDPSVAREVEQPAGALLMVRHAVWREIGGFDEEFFSALVRRRRFLPPRGRSGLSPALCAGGCCQTYRRPLNFAVNSRDAAILLVW